MTCPDCNARTFTVCGSNTQLPCDRCGATGEVPDAMVQWIQDGHKLRAKRVHSPDGYRSLSAEAARRGIDAETLARMERGCIAPILEAA